MTVERVCLLRRRAARFCWGAGNSGRQSHRRWRRETMSMGGSDVVLVLAFGLVLLVSVSLSGVAARTVLSTALLFLVAGALIGPGGALASWRSAPMTRLSLCSPT